MDGWVSVIMVGRIGR